jgi:hypothetical protein
VHNIGKLCVEGLDFSLQGLGFRFEGLHIFGQRVSFNVEILGVQGLGFSLQGLGLRVYMSLGKNPYRLP